MNSRIAYVASDRQIHVMNSDGAQQRPITYSMVPTALTRWGSSEGRDSCSWPVWSPDGHWVCCFQSPYGEDHGGPAMITAIEVDGVEEQALITLQGDLPIYAQWSPTSDRIAVVAQHEEELQLWTVTLDKLGTRRQVAEGVPLFFNWAPDGRILVHAGTTPGFVVLRDPHGDAEDLLLAESAGPFCTPMFAGESVILAHHGPSGSDLVRQPLVEGFSADPMKTMPGLVAALPSPDGKTLALAAAPTGGAPYQGIQLMNLEAGTSTTVVNQDVTAFFFDPLGTKIVFCTGDAPKTALTWHVVALEDGETRTLGRFWPTTDQLHHLMFFEQYSQSHPLVSPDGQTLVIAAHRDGDASTTPNILAVDLTDPDAVPVAIAEGSFAVFSRT